LSSIRKCHLDLRWLEGNYSLYFLLKKLVKLVIFAFVFIDDILSLDISGVHKGSGVTVI